MLENILIGLVCAVAGAAIFEFVKSLGRWMRSMRGAFSGHYLALTGNLNGGLILVESAKCRHVGDNLYGMINGISNIEFDPITGNVSQYADNKGSYKFDGFADGRVVVISYRSIIQRVQSSGSIALKGDDSGEVFSGAWAGLDNGIIVNTPCVWIRLNPSVSSKKKDLLKEAEKYLTRYKVSSSTMTLVCPPGTGKSMVIPELWAVGLDKIEKENKRIKNKDKKPNNL